MRIKDWTGIADPEKLVKKFRSEYLALRFKRLNLRKAGHPQNKLPPRAVEEGMFE
jgi:hypothetical protein